MKARPQKAEPVQTRKKQIGGSREASEWLDTYPPTD